MQWMALIKGVYDTQTPWIDNNGNAIAFLMPCLIVTLLKV